MALYTVSYSQASTYWSAKMGTGESLKQEIPRAKVKCLKEYRRL